MRKVLIIGIGAGDPEHVTVQAVNAMNAVDVFFVLDKGDTTADLIVKLNELYLKNKDRNFKAVAMIIAGDTAKPWLEELQASKHIEIPLVVLRRGPKDVAVRLYSLNPAVENTFLVTVDRFVAANVTGIGPAEFGRVADATATMLASQRAH